MAKVKFRELTDEDKQKIVSKCDVEGLEGYLMEGYATDDFEGTKHEEKLEQVKELMAYFEDLITGFADDVESEDDDIEEEEPSDD